MDLQSPFSLSTALIFFFSLFLFKLIKVRSRTQNAPQNMPPGPWKLPLVGSMLHLAGSLPHHALKNLASKHGPLMHLRLGEISAIVISSPRVATEVLKTHDLAFANRPTHLLSEIVMHNSTDIAGAPYGDYWRYMRKICTMKLLSAKKVESFRTIREDEVRLLIESIRSSSSSGSPINISKKMSSLINAIVCRATFGRRCKDQDALIQQIQEVLSLAGGFDVVALFPSLKLLHVIFGLRPKVEKLHRIVDQILNNIIDKRRKDLESTKRDNNSDTREEDLLDALLKLTEGGDVEFPVTCNNIKAVILDMFIAGTDTSSITIEWAIAEMIRNPRVMKKAQDELRQALKGKKLIHETDIHGLSYLKLVIKETLWLHPPLPLILPRECREQCEIDGYKIPIKTKVIVNAWAIGRDHEYWDDAESFVPERFEKSSVDVVGTNCEYIPFGAGRRMCPGIMFGLANVELPLAQMLYHFNWKLPSGMRQGDLDMTETFGATVKRRNDLYLIAAPHIAPDYSG